MVQVLLRVLLLFPSEVGLVCMLSCSTIARAKDTYREMQLCALRFPSTSFFLARVVGLRRRELLGFSARVDPGCRAAVSSCMARAGPVRGTKAAASPRPASPTARRVRSCNS